MSFVRAFSKVNRAGLRVPAGRAGPLALNAQRAFSVSAARCSDPHAEESFEEFTARYAMIQRRGCAPEMRVLQEPRLQKLPLGPIEALESSFADSCALNIGTRRSLRRSTMFSSSRYVGMTSYAQPGRHGKKGAMS
jgi:hypothetical protein